MAASPPAEQIPLSLLNDFLYCPRRAGLKIVEGVRSTNEHTLRGDIVHEHSDLPGFEAVRGVKLLRALPVWSARLGLSGKCDIVEEHPDGSLVPVEFKLGRRRAWENDDVQVCAQGLCLEEMFGRTVGRGAIFHASSKQRREVVFDEALRARTAQTAADLNALMESGRTPPAVLKPACEECSLYAICLPRATRDPRRAERLAHEALVIN